MSVAADYQDHISLWAQLASWVPGEVFDAHTHLGPAEVMGRLGPERLKEALCTFASFNDEQTRAWYLKLYGGKTVVGRIAFGFPLREVDIKGANDYVASIARDDSAVVPFILADPHDVSATIAQFDAGLEQGVRFRGIKPYFDLLGIDKPNSVFHCKDIDFCPLELLEFANSEQLIIMLHTSSIGIGAPAVREYVEMAATRFPRIKIILAHMGRYTKPEQFKDFFESSTIYHPNIYLDTSSATSEDVYIQFLSRRELWGKLLFGSDVPFGMITGVEHWSDTHGPIFITRDDYVWSDPQLNNEFAELRSQLSYNTYHVIQALRGAMERLDLSTEEQHELKSRIFSRNAIENLLGTSV